MTGIVAGGRASNALIGMAAAGGAAAVGIPAALAGAKDAEQGHTSWGFKGGIPALQIPLLATSGAGVLIAADLAKQGKGSHAMATATAAGLLAGATLGPELGLMFGDKPEGVRDPGMGVADKVMAGTAAAVVAAGAVAFMLRTPW